MKKQIATSSLILLQLAGPVPGISCSLPIFLRVKRIPEGEGRNTKGRKMSSESATSLCQFVVLRPQYEATYKYKCLTHCAPLLSP